MKGRGRRYVEPRLHTERLLAVIFAKVRGPGEQPYRRAVRSTNLDARQCRSGEEHWIPAEAPAAGYEGAVIGTGERPLPTRAEHDGPTSIQRATETHSDRGISCKSASVTNSGPAMTDATAERGVDGERVLLRLCTYAARGERDSHRDDEQNGR